ncbi:trigger factor [Hydrogenispora ethanolica]|jgi:trigger factor|uniref:Trigger factor n=1 Tax=Hydrogenispora ethanolica TaxID=1082276 RepID=A0A4R1RQE9_HYDET|nr:trigger factor [Hydrogenispora ethanolica]TCL68526.1 trigger factor [Hydrogenispora ethanolica]
MQFQREMIDKNFVTLGVTADTEEIKEALAESYKKVVNKVNLPGFRKGHIPRSVLEAHFGKSVLYEEAMEILVTKGYLQALNEMDLNPIDQPKLEMTEAFVEDQPFQFKLVMEVLPEVELGQYKGLEIEKAPVEIGDEQVEERLKSLQERHAELVLSDKTVLENGQFAVIDFEGYIDGKPFAGGAAQAYTLEIGSESFIPGFEEQLVGMKVGEEKELQVTFPNDYPREEFAGKEATFKVVLKEIKVKEVPAIDDEFAKSIGDFEDVAALKADLKAKMTTSAEQEAEVRFQQAAIDKAVENAQVEVPETLIKREMEDLLHRFEHNLTYQGLTLEKYQEYSNKGKEEIMEDFRPEAVKRVKTDLVLNSVAKAEKLEVTEEELTEKLQELATRYQQKDAAKLRKDLEKNGRIADIRQAVLLEKTSDLITSAATAASAQ